MTDAQLVKQATLHVQLRDDATFANYIPGDNQHIVAYLLDTLIGLAHDRITTQHQFIYLWGAAGVGCSHLLQAACHHVDASVYLPLADHHTLTPTVLTGLESLSLVCLDDIDAIVGMAAWEEALFHLYNRVRQVQGCLIVTATQSPRGLAANLPDLRSRLMWGTTFQLTELSDEQKCEALVLRANLRGMQLSMEVAHFLVRRLSRDMHTLFQQLTKLDHASLVAKHTLTLPFVKSVLGL